MRWADIDEAERTWTLLSEMTKAGRSHVVPLSPLALQILGEARETARLLHGEPENGKLATYVFTTRSLTGESAAIARPRSGSTQRLRRPARRAAYGARALDDP